MALLEVCAADIQSVIAAVEGGAARVELCSGLSADGMTPSAGLIAEARAVTAGKVALNILLRPDEDPAFAVTRATLRVLERDIDFAAFAGADGVVFGVLDSDNMPDIDICAPLVRRAHEAGLTVTFHRAFDRVPNPLGALERLINMNIDRVLTSGLAPSAPQGASMLAELNQVAGRRIIVMPGAGIRPDNIDDLLRLTGCTEFHSSARRSGSLVSDSDTVRSLVAAGASCNLSPNPVNPLR